MNEFSLFAFVISVRSCEGYFIVRNEDPVISDDQGTVNETFAFAIMHPYRGEVTLSTGDLLS